MNGVFSHNPVFSHFSSFGGGQKLSWSHFIGGVGSVLCLFPEDESFDAHNLYVSIPDIEALGHDFRAVGNDLVAAMQRHGLRSGHF